MGVRLLQTGVIPYYREEIKVHRAMESEEAIAGAVPVASE